MHASNPSSSSTKREAPPPEVGAYGDEYELVRRVLLGEEDALKEFSEHLGRIRAIVHVISRSLTPPVMPQEIPDLIQDCMVTVWRKLPEYRGHASLLTWIFRICSLEMRNATRRVHRHRWMGQDSARVFVSPSVATEDPPSGRFINLDLRDALSRLRESESRVLHLKYYEGKTLDEVAATLSLRPSQARTLYYRAMRRLQDYLDDQCSGDES